MSIYRKPANHEDDETPKSHKTLASAVMCLLGALFIGQMGVLVVGCIGVSSQDLNALQDAAKLNLAAYKHSDGGAERALERGAFCAVEGVLRRNDAGIVAGEISCP